MRKYARPWSFTTTWFPNVMYARDYSHHPDDDMVDIDYNTVAVASMIAIHGPNVAMAKLIFMHSVQSCYVERNIDWSSLGSRIANFALRIIGGTWSGGIYGWCYQHLEMAECYVCMIENKALWMGRTIGSGSGIFDADGFVQAV